MKLSSAPAFLLPLLAAPLALRVPDHVPAPGESAIVTLYARDGLASSFDFRNGREGGRIVDGQVDLSGAQLVYDSLVEGMITWGFVRDERAELISFGPNFVRPLRRARDAAAEFPVSVFHTLYFDGARFSYLGPGNDVNTLATAGGTLSSLSDDRLRSEEPLVGHVYVLRVRREGVGNGDEMFKFEVIGHIPGHSLTLRWAPMPRT